MPRVSRVAPVATLMLLLASAVPAWASTARIGVDELGDTVVFIESAGDVDDLLFVSKTAGGYEVRDATGITPGAGCSAVLTDRVLCPPGSGADAITGFEADLGDGDDTLRSDDTVDTPFGFFVDAGPGNDTVELDRLDDVLLGGPGNDVLLGGDGDDIVSGEEGDDGLDGGGGDDALDGGPGAGDIAGGGAGDDVISLREEADGLTGEADETLRCDAGDDLAAYDVLDPLQVSSLPDCETIAPLIRRPGTVRGTPVVGGRVALDTQPTAEGRPAPTLTPAWLSCAASACLERTGNRLGYLIAQADVGRTIAARLTATNGPPALGPFSTVAQTTNAIGPVTAPPTPPPFAFPLRPNPPSPQAVEQARLTRAAAALGGAASALPRPPAGVRIYQRGTSRTLTLRNSRSRNLHAVICTAPACKIAVTRRIDLQVRVGTRIRKQTIRLAPIRRALITGAITTVPFRTTPAQRKRIRKARRATLRLGYTVQARSPRGSKAAFTYRLRAR